MVECLWSLILRWSMGNKCLIFFVHNWVGCHIFAWNVEMWQLLCMWLCVCVRWNVSVTPCCHVSSRHVVSLTPRLWVECRLYSPVSCHTLDTLSLLGLSASGMQHLLKLQLLTTQTLWGDCITNDVLIVDIIKLASCLNYAWKLAYWGIDACGCVLLVRG